MREKGHGSLLASWSLNRVSWFQVPGQAVMQEGEVSREGHPVGPGHVE